MTTGRDVMPYHLPLAVWGDAATPTDAVTMIGDVVHYADDRSGERLAIVRSGEQWVYLIAGPADEWTGMLPAARAADIEDRLASAVIANDLGRFLVALIDYAVEQGVVLSDPWSQGADEVDLVLALLSGLPARDRQAQETLLALARRDEWAAVLLRQRVLDEGGR